MRGDLELHPRHVVYTLSGAFAGISVKYFINKVIYGTDAFLTDPENLSVLFLFGLFLTGIFCGIFIDACVRNPAHESSGRRFPAFEIIAVTLFDLTALLLLVLALRR